MSDYICTSCGYEGRRLSVKPGSRGMEIFLWAALMVPEPFYSSWRFFWQKTFLPALWEAKRYGIAWQR